MKNLKKLFSKKMKKIKHFVKKFRKLRQNWLKKQKKLILQRINLKKIKKK